MVLHRAVGVENEYPARYPASASRPDSVNAGRTVATAVDVDVDVVVALIRYLPKQPEPGRRDHQGPSND